MFSKIVTYTRSITMSDLLVSSLITGILNIIATAIPSFIAYLYANKFLSVKRAHKTTYNALREIKYLKEIVRVYGQESSIHSNKIRKLVSIETGLTSTNQFTPVKLNTKLEHYAEKIDTNPFMPD